MNKQIEDKLRLLKVDLLRILYVLAITDSLAVELNEISDSTSTAESELKGSISALRRIKFDNETLVVPAGRDDDGRIRWQINKKIVDKKELVEFLNEVLDDK